MYLIHSKVYLTFECVHKLDITLVNVLVCFSHSKNMLMMGKASFLNTKKKRPIQCFEEGRSLLLVKVIPVHQTSLLSVTKPSDGRDNPLFVAHSTERKELFSVFNCLPLIKPHSLFSFSLCIFLHVIRSLFRNVAQGEGKKPSPLSFS